MPREISGVGWVFGVVLKAGLHARAAQHSARGQAGYCSGVRRNALAAAYFPARRRAGAQLLFDGLDRAIFHRMAVFS
jgi:hypothetical protein